ncbi:J domain-containing protein [Synechococcus sp. PCC 7336]|uniref:J domain-containing protein n=1 Tax=Synechococcus sp. PCC 7336 TaxID=195250 RepID=UPI00034CCEA4|nr:J domain-containing protein [Synechococcus sp. PCC 7336]
MTELGIGTPTIEEGLAQYEPDYYAVLGVPVTADSRLIRKGYILVAKQLHPDRYIDRPNLRPTANWLFSKLISPASEVLNRERERVEYREVLRLRVKRLLKLPPAEIWPKSYLADSLLYADDLETVYHDTILKLAEHQYRDLDKALVCSGELSKINLAYLLLEGGYKVAVPSTPLGTLPPNAKPSPAPISSVPAAPRANRPAAQASPTPPPSAPTDASPAPNSEPAAPAPGQTRYLQAQQMLESGHYKEAIQYFKFAIAAAPQNPDYYLGRGTAYLKLKNTMRARQDFQKVLSLKPDNAKAKKYLDELASTNGNGKKTASATNRTSNQSARPQPKGMFGRIFNR